MESLDKLLSNADFNKIYLQSAKGYHTGNTKKLPNLINVWDVVELSTPIVVEANANVIFGVYKVALLRFTQAGKL